jgi:hypothetical protein
MARKMTIAEVEDREGNLWLCVRMPLPKWRVVVKVLMIAGALAILKAGFDIETIQRLVEFLMTLFSGAS